MISRTSNIAFSPETGGAGVAPKDIPAILKKLGTFARAVATEEYKIDQGFAFESGLIFPLLGINHLVTRGIFQSLERIQSNSRNADLAGSAKGTADVAAQNPAKFLENGDQHFSAAELKAIKSTIAISKKVLDAEKEGTPLQSAISIKELKAAYAALRSTAAAIDTLAIENPDQIGLKALASDMNAVSGHYYHFTKSLFPSLGNDKAFKL